MVTYGLKVTMIFNQTVNLDTNGDPVSTPISDDHVKSYITDFVSNKSSLYDLLTDSSYQINIDLDLMELEGKKIYFKHSFEKSINLIFDKFAKN